MSDKIVENGQMANDPELNTKQELNTGTDTEKSYVIPESEDQFFKVKKKWKWKPTRLILLWLFMEYIQILYLSFLGLLVACFVVKINISEVDVGQILAIVLSMKFFKTWWNK